MSREADEPERGGVGRVGWKREREHRILVRKEVLARLQVRDGRDVLVFEPRDGGEVLNRRWADGGAVREGVDDELEVRRWRPPAAAHAHDGGAQLSPFGSAHRPWGKDDSVRRELAVIEVSDRVIRESGNADAIPARVGSGKGASGGANEEPQRSVKY